MTTVFRSSYHFSTILAHRLYEYLRSNRGARRLFTREHLLSKASMWPRESRIRGQDSRRWRCWYGEKYKERNPQELSHLEHIGRNILSPPKCRSIGMLVCLLNARSNFWGCPLTFCQMDSGYLAFPSQIHWAQPVQQQSGNAEEEKLLLADIIWGITAFV